MEKQAKNSEMTELYVDTNDNRDVDSHYAEGELGLQDGKKVQEHKQKQKTSDDNILMLDKSKQRPKSKQKSKSVSGAPYDASGKEKLSPGKRGRPPTKRKVSLWLLQFSLFKIESESRASPGFFREGIIFNHFFSRFLQKKV